MKTNFRQYADADLGDANDLGVFYLGIAHAAAEDMGYVRGKSSITDGMVTARLPDWLGCMGDIAAGLFSLDQLIDDYVVLFTEGASWNTVWPVVRNFVRRYAGWIAVAAFAYDFVTECL